ncbi:DUF6318 family protein [Kineococcus sp. SYSU DK001]|uniref:DUF6318 family protein n=1 Tax=Kineococcus sp. SYSU DK001 TaxID=3383122 RepID=UPI003D7F030F
MIQLRPLTAAATGLVCLGLLAGCSNEEAAAPAASASATPTRATVASTDAPVPPPTTSATPNPTTTRDLPAPELSGLATQFSREGASAFASYYIKVLNYSRNTGDVELLTSISDVDCAGCADDVDDVSTFLAEGLSHVGLETQFIGTHYLSWEEEIGEVQMDVYASRPPHTIVDRFGHTTDEVEGIGETPFFLWLKWVDGRWVVWEAQ